MLPRPWFASSLRVLVRESFETIILALLVFMVLHISIQNYKVEGPSMQPTLNQNEYLIVNKLVYLNFDPAEVLDALPFFEGEAEANGRYLFHPPVRGEVVVFRSPRDPERDFVKRVIGLPGDTVEIDLDRRDNTTTVATQRSEPYLDRRDNTTMAPVQGRAGHPVRSRRQPRFQQRLAVVGPRSRRKPHRPRVDEVLAARPPGPALAPGCRRWRGRAPPLCISPP